MFVKICLTDSFIQHTFDERLKLKTMKNLDKQQFSKLVLFIGANYLRNYFYDLFYDIKVLREIEINNERCSFHLYFRRSGSDRLFDNEPDQQVLHDTYKKRNTLMLYVNYTPNIDHCCDVYKVEVIKDDYQFLLWNEILSEK
jgi:hypothetical protein